MKYLFFDMDGVLLDSEPRYLDRLRRHLAHYGVDCTREELQRFVGMTSGRAAQILVEENRLPLTPQEFWAEESRMFGILYRDDPELALFEGAKELLAILEERGIRTALVSSTSAMGILLVLDRFGLTRCFDAVVSREMVETHKPSPEPYLTAARLLGAAPGDCLVVEDSPMGIAAGKAAGMEVAALRASVIRQDVSEADWTAENYQELCQSLERRGWL